MEQFAKIPTHIVQILKSGYNDNPSNLVINVIGSEVPALPNSIGYDVLCEDGVYRYMSLIYKEIKVISTINN